MIISLQRDWLILEGGKDYLFRGNRLAEVMGPSRTKEFLEGQTGFINSKSLMLNDLRSLGGTLQNLTPESNQGTYYWEDLQNGRGLIITYERGADSIFMIMQRIRNSYFIGWPLFAIYFEITEPKDFWDKFLFSPGWKKVETTPIKDPCSGIFAEMLKVNYFLIPGPEEVIVR